MADEVNPEELVKAAMGPPSAEAPYASSVLRRQWAPKRERELVEWYQDSAIKVTFADVARIMEVTAGRLNDEYPTGWE